MPKHKNHVLHPLARYGIVALASLLFSAICALLMALIALGNENPSANLYLYGEIIFILTMFLCGFAGAKSAREGRLLSGLLSASVLLLITVISSIFLGGIMPKALILAAMGAVSALIGSLIGAREREKEDSNL